MNIIKIKNKILTFSIINKILIILIIVLGLLNLINLLNTPIIFGFIGLLIYSFYKKKEQLQSVLDEKLN